VLEAGDEFLGTQHQRLVVAGTAGKSLAADLADVIDGDAVAIGRLAFLRLVGPGGFGDALNLLLDLVFGNVVNGTLDLDVGELLDLDGGDDLVVQLELEIDAAGED